MTGRCSAFSFLRDKTQYADGESDWHNATDKFMERRSKTMNKMGVYIKQKRIERGLSISELAQMVGVTEKKIEDWENDDSFPVIFRVEPLCAHLECTVTQLLSGDDNASTDALILELLCKVEKYKSLGIALIGLILTQVSLNTRVAVGTIVGDFLSGLCLGISTGVTVIGVFLFAYGLSLFYKIRDKKEGNQN